ncbi:MAG: hypothetical protein HQ462_01395 [Deltaproteobacteria bacterium]|nr:hypothetical protein [Deltaproteobacteria bacterium]
MAAKTKSGSTQNELVQCDLEFPTLQDQLKKPKSLDFEAFFNKVEKINEMTWQQVYATSSKGKAKRGLNWEALPNQRTASGGTVASIRITDKFRARVTRDGVFMRFISLHPDHDSAYKAKGGEAI